MADNSDVNPHHIIPSSPYGITSQRYADVENPLVPLPQRGIMQAANRLNEFRHRKLTEKQRVFLDVYLSTGFNAAEAASRAGYCSDIPRDDKYERACGAVGNRLRKNKAIAHAIDLACEYHTEREKINTSQLITELKYIALSNMGDYFVNDGNGDPRIQMPGDHERGKLAALSEITVESYDEGRGDNKREVKRVKFKTHNKMEAIEKLFKVAAAQGDPLLAKVTDQDKPTSNVNVFNVLPVPSGEFIPAPPSPHAQRVVVSPQIPSAPPTALVQPDPHTPAPLHIAGPSAPNVAVRWEQPERAQKRSLTIDHEP